jgi:hypothetical protein
VVSPNEQHERVLCRAAFRSRTQPVPAWLPPVFAGRVRRHAAPGGDAVAQGAPWWRILSVRSVFARNRGRRKSGSDADIYHTLRGCNTASVYVRVFSLSCA